MKATMVKGQLAAVPEDKNTLAARTAPEAAKHWHDIAIFVMAVVLVLGYFGVDYMLFDRALSLDDGKWNRAMLLHGGLEAIVFAAAGYLFGQQVNRARAENAEQQIDDAQQRAESAQTKANVAGEELATKRAQLEIAISGMTSAPANTTLELENDDKAKAAKAEAQAAYLKWLAHQIIAMDEPR
jgi:hypothetical protein